jgi:hypothetical protein
MTLQDAIVQNLVRQAAKYPDCERCQRAVKVGNTAMPPHEPTKECVAGKRPHCACRRCVR